MLTLVSWMEWVFSGLQIGVLLVIGIWIGVLLPMSLFRKRRVTVITVLMYTSFFNGFTCWWFSFIISYKVLGGFWLFVGLIMGGIGVLPLAILGAAIHGLWFQFWNLILAAVLAFGPRILAMFIAYRHDKREQAEADQLSCDAEPEYATIED